MDKYTGKFIFIFFLLRQWVLVHLDETKTSHFYICVAQGESGKVRLRRLTSAKKGSDTDCGVSGSVDTTLNILKNIYGFVSRALKNKYPRPIIYDSVTVMAEFRFCSACHNLLEKFVDFVDSLIFNFF